MLVINLFGAPGSGKSTGAAYIFSKLKMYGINAELVTEFAKDKVWEESKEVFNNQAYIFGKQYFRISRLNDKVEVVITDSPLLLSSFYNKSEVLGDNFNNMVKDVFNAFNSMNVLIKRTKPYNPAGRFQSEDESDELSEKMKSFLKSYDVEYKTYNGDLQGYDKLVNEILKTLYKETDNND